MEYLGECLACNNRVIIILITIQDPSTSSTGVGGGVGVKNLIHTHCEMLLQCYIYMWGGGGGGGISGMLMPLHTQICKPITYSINTWPFRLSAFQQL